MPSTCAGYFARPATPCCSRRPARASISSTSSSARGDSFVAAVDASGARRGALDERRAPLRVAEAAAAGGGRPAARTTASRCSARASSRWPRRPWSSRRSAATAIAGITSSATGSTCSWRCSAPPSCCSMPTDIWRRLALPAVVLVTVVLAAAGARARRRSRTNGAQRWLAVGPCLVPALGSLAKVLLLFCARRPPRCARRRACAAPSMGIARPLAGCCCCRCCCCSPSRTSARRWCSSGGVGAAAPRRRTAARPLRARGCWRAALAALILTRPTAWSACARSSIPGRCSTTTAISSRRRSSPSAAVSGSASASARGCRSSSTCRRRTRTSSSPSSPRNSARRRAAARARLRGAGAARAGARPHGGTPRRPLRERCSPTARALLLGVQALVSVLGVNTGVLPTKGLTLPLVSYGGNALIAPARSSPSCCAWRLARTQRRRDAGRCAHVLGAGPPLFDAGWACAASFRIHFVGIGGSGMMRHRRGPAEPRLRDLRFGPSPTSTRRLGELAGAHLRHGQRGEQIEGADVSSRRAPSARTTRNVARRARRVFPSWRGRDARRTHAPSPRHRRRRHARQDHHDLAGHGDPRRRRASTRPS